MFDLILLGNSSGHIYSVAAIGCKLRTKDFSSREMAKRYMYNYLDRHGIQVKEKWHDGHYVTYVCNNGIKVFINRF